MKTIQLKNITSGLMKRFVTAICLVIAIAGTQRLYAQSGCSTSGCHRDTINISTGYDEGTNTYLGVGSTETGWVLDSVPSNCGTASPGGPIYVISPVVGAWGGYPNAQWLSPFPTYIYSPNNAPGSGLGAFVFRRCFCVCQTSSVRMKFDMMGDDQLDAYFGGTQIAGPAGYANAWQKSIDTTMTLAPGQYCITLKLYNIGSGGFGFDLQGYVAGQYLLSSSCCNPSSNGKVCGTKYWDENCDGRIDASVDSPLPGWTIQASNGTSVVASAVTAADGSYCLTLPPGTYTISEVNQTGWTQSYPGGSGTYTVTVTAGSNDTRNFANCRSSTPCDNDPSFNYDVKKCMASFTSDFAYILSLGYQVGGVHWDFGDGTSSSEMNPVHFYANPGSYNVCLYANIYDGTTCCVKSFCQTVNVDEKCEGNCDMDVQIDIALNTSTCTYTFTRNIINTDIPITGYLWDFDDGTTDAGPVVSHQFPGPGGYHVCLLVFGKNPQNPDECCFRRFCRDVDVQCDPCDKATGGGKNKTGSITPGSQGSKQPANSTENKNVAMNKITLSDKNIIVLNQNVPNPFKESTVISYQIPASAQKAEIIFTNVEGKLVRRMEIKTRGEGSLNVYAEDLSSGIYKYVLIVDGKNIDSKTMLKH